MSTFGAATFGEQGSVSPRIGGEAIGTYQRIAGGPRIWQGPATPVLDESIQIAAQGTEAQYDALYAKLGTTDTLSWGVGGTSLSARTATARLMSISDAQRLKQGNVLKFTMQFEVE